jgi:hypothetical protein
LNTADIMASKSSLEYSVDMWEVVAHVFTFLVASGLIIEYRAPFMNFIKTRDPRYIIESIGGVLVTIGVAGELLAGFRSTTQDGKLREANTELARRSAELLAASHERIAELNLMAEQERLARVKIEARLAWRRITNEQFSRFVEVLKPYADSPASICLEGRGDHEVESFAGALFKVFHSAGWNIWVDPSRANGPAPIGISCRVDDRFDSGKAAIPLLTELPYATVTRGPIAGCVVQIIVGLRPPA